MDGVGAVIARAAEADTPEALGAVGIALRFGEARFQSPDLLTVDGAPCAPGGTSSPPAASQPSPPSPASTGSNPSPTTRSSACANSRPP